MKKFTFPPNKKGFSPSMEEHGTAGGGLFPALGGGDRLRWGGLSASFIILGSSCSVQVFLLFRIYQITSPALRALPLLRGNYSPQLLRADSPLGGSTVEDREGGYSAPMGKWTRSGRRGTTSTVL